MSPLCLLYVCVDSPMHPKFKSGDTEARDSQQSEMFPSSSSGSFLSGPVRCLPGFRSYFLSLELVVFNFLSWVVVS